MSERKEFRITLEFVDGYQPGGKFSVSIWRSNKPDRRIVTYLYSKDFLYAVFQIWGHSPNEINSWFSEAEQGKDVSFFENLDQEVINHFVTDPFFESE
jgi:hypothetical protein